MTTISIGTVSELKIADGLFEQFYADNWTRKISLSEHTFSRWQFASAPSAKGLNQSIVAYDAASGKIAGAMGLNPRPFYLNGTVRQGAELTTWIVANEYRGTGAGAKILAEIQRRYDVLIGLGISAMALPIYLRSGFRYLRAIPRFVKVLNIDNAARFGSISSVGRKLQSRTSQIASPPVSVGEERDAGPLFERLQRNFNMFDRSLDQLIWRYRDHPTFHYETHLISSDIGQAFVATRLETAVDGLRVLHVIDCIGDDEAMPAAIAFVLDKARLQRADFCDIYSTSASLNRFYLSYGWHSILDDDAVQMPHLFHPVELRQPATTSLIYWAKDQMVDMADFSRLYISKQDADFDRPVPLVDRARS